eukprot:SAG22_NODE_1699_length_3787_cov_60.283623_2_plen_132_part_00
MASEPAPAYGRRALPAAGMLGLLAETGWAGVLGATYTFKSGDEVPAVAGKVPGADKMGFKLSDDGFGDVVLQARNYRLSCGSCGLWRGEGGVEGQRALRGTAHLSPRSTAVRLLPPTNILLVLAASRRPKR